jgi:hypothetical protein
MLDAEYPSGEAFNYPQVFESIVASPWKNLESDESLVIPC